MSSIIQDPNANFWTVVAQRLQQSGVTDQQVQAIWFKEADASPTSGWPAYAQTLRAEFETVMNVLRSKFPNARVCFVASRIYAGYATSLLNPEPYSYEQGFACKWLIEDQINGDAGLNFVPARGPVVSPWIDWGTYNWADGLTPRSDGLTWDCADFQAYWDAPLSTSVATRSRTSCSTSCTASRRRAGTWPGPPRAPYGTGKLTSILTRPVAAWSGSPSLTTNDFHVRIENALPNGIGIVFMAQNPARSRSSTRRATSARRSCVWGCSRSTGAGASSWAVPVSPMMVGRTICYQGYVRDAQQSDGTGAGLSSGLRVIFWP